MSHATAGRRALKLTRGPGYLLSIAGATAVALPAAAQDMPAEAAASSALEEIVVSARRREENLQQTPVAVSAFSGADLEQRRIETTADLTHFVPNVQFDGVASESGGGASTQVAIRGIGQTDYVLTVEPGVGVYLDGVYISKSVGSLIETLDLERVEILRGPQGTLFGRNTIGGAVVLTSRPPAAEPDFSVDLTTGQFDRFDAKTSLSVPVSDDLRVRFSGAYQSRDGHVDRVTPGGEKTGETQGGRSALSGRLVAEIDLTDALAATVSIDGSQIEEESPGQVLVRADENGAFASLYNAFVPGGQCLPSAGDARFANTDCFNSQWVRPTDSLRTTNSGANTSDTDVWGTALTLDWSLTDAVGLKSITAYREVSVDVSQELTASPAYYNEISQRISLEQFSQEFQLSGTAWDDRVKYLAGVYYLTEEGRQAFPVDLTLVQFLSGGRIDNESYAVFGQLTFAVTDRLSATAGLRYTDEKRGFSPEQRIVGYEAQTTVAGFVNPIAGAFGPPGTPLFPPGWYEREDDAVTPSLTLDYRFTPDVFAYLTYSEGFKGGGFVMRYFPPVIPGPGTDPDTIIGYAKPETAKLYELGLKTELFDRRVRLNVAAFLTDYEDLQLTFNVDPDGAGPIGAFVPVLANAGEARMSGIEIESQWVATDWLRFDLAAGFLDSEYRSFSDLAQQQLGTLPEELPNAPRFTGHLGATLDLMSGSQGRLSLRADYAYKEEQYKEFTNDPTLRQEAYGVVNAALTYETSDGHWLATFGGTNLTDEVYIVSGVTNSGIGYAQAVVSRPREWFLQLKYSY
jgi:iron complex outermembrane receptor protein